MIPRNHLPEDLRTVTADIPGVIQILQVPAPYTCAPISANPATGGGQHHMISVCQRECAHAEAQNPPIRPPRLTVIHTSEQGIPTTKVCTTFQPQSHHILNFCQLNCVSVNSCKASLRFHSLHAEASSPGAKFRQRKFTPAGGAAGPEPASRTRVADRGMRSACPCEEADRAQILHSSVAQIPESEGLPP